MALPDVEFDQEFKEAVEKTTKWISTLMLYPGFSEWKNKSTIYTLTYDGIYHEDAKFDDDDFKFPDHIEKQHEIVTKFFSLHSSYQAFSDIEFYFRRYPFGGMGLLMHDHLRYTCENYFNRIYEFKERLKEFFNCLKPYLPKGFDVGKVLKSYSRYFSNELKQRNLIQHHYRFEDVVLSKVSMAGLMAIGGKEMHAEYWLAEQKRTYRKASREWAARTRAASKLMRGYLNFSSMAISKFCDFLDQPVTSA